MQVADVEVRQVATQVGRRIQLTITTDNIPARSLLDRGEARMVAEELIRLSRTVVLP